MRKLLILLSTLFVFSGCDVEDQFKADANLEKFEGMLVEQELNDSEKGTHFLVISDSEKMTLRSLTINLSNTEYLDNKVEVIGFESEEDGVFEITGISVLEVLNGKENRGNLVAYKSSELGFQTKYYDSWEILEEPSSVAFSIKDGEIVKSRIVIEQYGFTYTPTVPEDDTPLKALEYYFAQTGNGGSPVDFTKVGIDQLDAVKVVVPDSEEYTLYRAGLIYKLRFESEGDDDPRNGLAFKQVVSEFRFIGFTDEEEVIDEEEVVDESDLPQVDMTLTGFESLPYYFSGKYPSSWYYAGSKSSNPQVLHHYAFSEESVTPENEIIGLDVLAGSIPSAGKDITVGGRQMKEVNSGENYILYTSIDGQNYRLTGKKAYKDLIQVMAANIKAVEKDGE